MSKKTEVIAALNSVKGAWTKIANELNLDPQLVANIANKATLKVDSDVIESLHNYLGKPLIEQKGDD